MEDINTNNNNNTYNNTYNNTCKEADIIIITHQNDIHTNTHN